MTYAEWQRQLAATHETGALLLMYLDWATDRGELLRQIATLEHALSLVQGEAILGKQALSAVPHQPEAGA